MLIPILFSIGLCQGWFKSCPLNVDYKKIHAARLKGYIAAFKISLLLIIYYKLIKC